MCDRVSGLLRSLSPRTLLALGTVFSVAGCGGDDGPTQPDSQPTTGTVEVTATTTGDTLDIDGYVVTLDGGVSETLDVNATVEFTDVDEGTYEIAVSDIQANCAPEGDRTRMVDVTAGDTTTMALSVACRAALFDRMVFTSTRDVGATELYVMGTDGSAVTRLTENVDSELHPAVSPDGTMIAYASSPDGSDRAIWIRNADGSEPRRVTSGAGGNEPDWSPDGTRIAFASDQDGDYEIYTIAPDGTGLEQLTDNEHDDRGPVWSPDGESIAFDTDRDGHLEIYTMDADGSSQTRVTNDTRWDVYPSWSPDGTRIAFARLEGETYDLYTSDPDGSELQRLTDNVVHDIDGVWSPDGSTMAFTTERDANQEIYIMSPDGTNPINLTQDAGRDQRPTWTPAR